MPDFRMLLERAKLRRLTPDKVVPVTSATPSSSPGEAGLENQRGLQIRVRFGKHEMGRPRTKRHRILESAACLDVGTLVRSGGLSTRTETAGLLRVFYHPSNAAAGEVHLVCLAPNEERATAWVSFCLSTGQRIQQRLDLVSLPRVPYGGRRWFFLCPQTGTRACRLYLPPAREGFLSREAHGLRYAIEHDTREDADIRHVSRLYARISGEQPPTGSLSPLPPRRKGMHNFTYQRLTSKMMRVQGRVIDSLARELEQLWKR